MEILNATIQDVVQKFGLVVEKFPEVKYIGDPILRQIAKEVSVQEGIEIGKRLGDVLLRYRQAVGFGRGFAAPQIGENKAVFVTFVDNKLTTFINPLIIEKSPETNFYRELCLSSGIMAADIERAEWIVMEWTDGENVKQRKKFDGFLARLYQHEEAHIRGVVNLDEAVKGTIEFALFNPLDELLRKTKR